MIKNQAYYRPVFLPEQSGEHNGKELCYHLNIVKKHLKKTEGNIQTNR